MQLREYRSSDCKYLAELFYHTIHCTNARDYTEEQLNAWATGKVELQKWNKSFREHKTIVAVEKTEIVGFGDIDRTGYLDKLYVHKDYQRQGIANALCDKLEYGFDKITTHASITAKPFFESRGYRVIKKQQVERQGIFLINYMMEK